LVDLLVHVKKPECPAWKRGPTLKGGDEWAFSLEESPCGRRGFFTSLGILWGRAALRGVPPKDSG